MKNNVSIAASIVIAGLLIGGAFIFAGRTTPSGAVADDSAIPGANIKVENGVQTIEISAKGGYYPKKNQAQADIPTVIRVTTNGTFDCSASLVIPAIGYSGYLPRTGTTDIQVPPQKSGTTLRGLCSMGMYSFTVDFL